MPKDLIPLGWVVPINDVRRVFTCMLDAMDKWVRPDNLHMLQYRAMATQAQVDILREQVFVGCDSEKPLVEYKE